MIHLEGLGHEIELKFFDKNEYLTWGYKGASTGLCTFKMGLWWAVLITIFHPVKLKTYSRINAYWIFLYIYQSSKLC